MPRVEPSFKTVARSSGREREHSGGCVKDLSSTGFPRVRETTYTAANAPNRPIGAGSCGVFFLCQTNGNLHTVGETCRDDQLAVHGFDELAQRPHVELRPPLHLRHLCLAHTKQFGHRFLCETSGLPKLREVQIVGQASRLSLHSSAGVRLRASLDVRPLVALHVSPSRSSSRRYSS